MQQFFCATSGTKMLYVYQICIPLIGSWRMLGFESVDFVAFNYIELNTEILAVSQTKSSQVVQSFSNGTK